MTTKNTFTLQPIDRNALAKRIIIGAAIALAVILRFVLDVDTPKPEWGSNWMIRPLIITPLSGAAGGFCFYFLDYYLGRNGGWKKSLALAAGIVVYVVGLWLGIVLGLDGTLWN
jgi:uncharacterized membrane-anchored protein